MAQTNISIGGLESYQPALDYRKSNKVGVLRGKNFAWDASGVYAAYASRLVAGSTSVGMSPDIVQSINVKTQVHIACGDKIKRMVPSSPSSPIGYWQDIATLTRLVKPNPQDVPYDFRRWSSAYLGNSNYACSWNYGVYRVNLGASDMVLPTYTRLTSGSVTGFPSDATPVICIAETNGRMIYLTETTVYWSAPNAPETLTPALGGAGFQVVNERIAGTPYIVTPIAVGAIIWTSQGALVMEFIGGDAVFRFYTLNTDALPMTSFGLTRLPDDDWIILTRLGLFMFNNASQPTPISPVFNEFLREYFRTKPSEVGHLWYSINDNRLYIGMRSNKVSFTETYALDVTLDRWGIFSTRHIGLFTYATGRGAIAYALPNGIVSFLLASTDPRKNKENPEAPGTYTGLGSEIAIGWLRAENLVPFADTIQETQEIVLYRSNPFADLETTSVDEEYFDSASPDTFDEGLITTPSADIFDEGFVTDRPIPYQYSLTVVSDFFEDQNYNYFPAHKVQTARYSDTWVVLCPAYYHRLLLAADADGEYFRINAVDITVAYEGNTV